MLPWEGICILSIHSFNPAIWGLVCVVLVTLTPSTSNAFEVNPDNLIPNTVANSLIVNGDGGDWNSAVLLIELASGSIYNPLEFDALQPQLNIWNFVPELEFDSWVGIPGDDSGSIFGGAGDLGVIGPAEIGGQRASVTWFNTDVTNTSPVRIANMTLTDNAFGRYSVIVGFSGQVLLQETGYVTNGVLTLNAVAQGDLDGDAFVGIGDLNLVLSNWNQTSPHPADIWADANSDGFVGITDLNTVLANWNTGIPPLPTELPEPGSLAVLLAGAAALLRRRRSV